MLKGRESLRRIIGKRRRFLSNLSNILSYSCSLPSNSVNDGNGKQLLDGSATVKTEANSIDDKLEGSSSEKGFVDCPVCSTQIRADDWSVNSHLGKFYFSLIFVEYAHFR